MKNKPILWLLPLLLMGCADTDPSQLKERLIGGNAEERVIAVGVQQIDTMGGLVRNSYPGYLEEGNSVDISFKYGGTLQTLNVKEGSTVRKGQVLARQQFSLKAYQFPTLEIASASNNLKVEETVSYVRFEAAGTALTIGKQSGWIDYLDVNGAPMLMERESLTPMFWRAPTDNDYGAGLQRRFAAWREPEMKLQGVEVKADGAVATFQLPGVKATLTMTYTLKTDGQVLVREQLSTEKGADISPMFRYGMQLQMPKEFSQVEYYGRGPVENYIDRNSSEFIEVYQNSVADEYFPYVRPQEAGNHTDVRWFRVKDEQGRGLEFYASQPIEVSALNYSVADLDDGMTKDKVWGRHSGDLEPRPFTQVLIQQRQMGLGCVNSWGAWPRKEYMVPYHDYDFTFAIRPLQSK